MHEYSLFEYYPVTSELKSAADATRQRTAKVKTVVSHLDADHRRALASVAGVLQGPVADAPTATVTRAASVVQKAEYAASCVEYFGTAVDTYDFNSSQPRSISKLNAAYAAGVSSSFGATERDPGPHPTSKESAKAQADYLKAYDAGRVALINQLTREHAQLDAHLDKAAGTVGTMLQKGPTEANLRTLWAAGALPPYAVVLYPNADFSGITMPASLQRELVDYLKSHPELLVNPPFAFTGLIDGLPPRLLQELRVAQSVQSLRNAGLLGQKDVPGAIYEAWIKATLATGLTPAQIVDRARQEGVDLHTFDTLDGLQMVKEPNGKMFFVITSAGDARQIVELTQLVNGGEPSKAENHGKNGFSYDGDVQLVLHTGGALIATPMGTMMGMGGNPIVDMFSQNGGTTWGDIFMLNGNPDDPKQALINIIESGHNPNANADDTAHTLDRLLHHESIHSDQWARYGYTDFIARYLDASTNWTWRGWGPFKMWLPEERDPCDNEYEQEAGLDDGGYSC